mmetsp:Transcript_17636/g.42920  ORF Transcript_17636/g.42920 Transcript_17636/m.42920 type:complete len:131 (-) Transcript_17636:92-484(-)
MERNGKEGCGGRQEEEVRKKVKVKKRNGSEDLLPFSLFALGVLWSTKAVCSDQRSEIRERTQQQRRERKERKNPWFVSWLEGVLPSAAAYVECSADDTECPIQSIKIVSYTIPGITSRAGCNSNRKFWFL